MEKPMNNEKLESVLPDLKKEFNILNSDDFKKYEEKLSTATNKAVDALQGIIEDGTLAMDPEQLVKAVQTLTKAKVDILESKRKLLESLVRGEVMLKALEPPKKEPIQDNALVEYLKNNNFNTNLGETSSNSIFGEVEKCSTD